MIKFYFNKITLFTLSILIFGCKQNEMAVIKKSDNKNTIQYAKGLEIFKHDGFTVVKIKNPWPKSKVEYTYILQEKNGIVPDSLIKFNTIQVPINTIVATSTTHIPSLEMLGVENSLVGFPNLNYISSDKVRKRIEANKIKELGNNQALNIEAVLDISPSVIMGYGIDNNNPGLDNLQKSGLKVILNGDWNEQTPLGKAEWIKLFGALYGKEKQAENIFATIEKEYKATLLLAKKAKFKPTVIAGAMYENIWYMPQGDSWGSLFLKDAQANYLYSNTKGSGSLALPFETVFEKGKEAQFWIQGQFSTLKEIEIANKHYTQFNAFKTKNVYSFGSKKGKTGGVLYYELAPNRPDLVLKDLVKILHPELLPNYTLYFFEKIN